MCNIIKGGIMHYQIRVNVERVEGDERTLVDLVRSEPFQSREKVNELLQVMRSLVFYWPQES